MKKNIAKKLAKRKRKIDKRLEKRNWEDQPRPIMTGGNIHYDIDGRHQAISNGGIGNPEGFQISKIKIDKYP